MQNASSPFGATVGRVANRISKAQFTLNGIVYKLPANSGNNTIHGNYKSYYTSQTGSILISSYIFKTSFLISFWTNCSLVWWISGGPIGFSKVVWKVKKYSPDGAIPRIDFAYHSFDGEQGKNTYFMKYFLKV